ncbi:MAG TPA: hypothetical protein VF698_17825, partial [Thermoanaerobaculia bacterium]
MTHGRLTIVCLLFLIALASCRSSQSGGRAFAPLAATTADAAREELRARRQSFAGARSLMRIRVTTPEKTQSFRAQLIMNGADEMELVAYTPIGTTAGKLTAKGSDVRFDPPQPADALRIFHETLPPAELAMLLLGIPPREGPTYEFTPAGLARATINDATVTFEPSSFPAQRVV